MFSLPQLIDEDMRALDAACESFLYHSGAMAAVVVDQGGFVITHKGWFDGLDTATLGALAANSFAATHAMAKLVNENNVASVYQEGAHNSVLIARAGGYGYLVVVFPAEIGVGAVKYHAEQTLKKIVAQFNLAHDRAPGDGLDLSDLNLADASPVFRRK